MLQEWKQFMTEVWRSGELQNILVLHVFHWITYINIGLSKPKLVFWMFQILL